MTHPASRLCLVWIRPAVQTHAARPRFDAKNGQGKLWREAKFLVDSHMLKLKMPFDWNSGNCKVSMSVCSFGNSIHIWCSNHLLLLGYGRVNIETAKWSQGGTKWWPLQNRSVPTKGFQIQYEEVFGPKTHKQKTHQTSGGTWKTKVRFIVALFHRWSNEKSKQPTKFTKSFFFFFRFGFLNLKNRRFFCIPDSNGRWQLEPTPESWTAMIFQGRTVKLERCIILVPHLQIH